jgi:hypothetical protein
MKLFISLAAVLILLNGCGGAQTNRSVVSVPTPGATISSLPDDAGLVLQCKKCLFVEEQGFRYIQGEVHNDAKQVVTGYALAIDLQDAKGQSVKKIPGMMLMKAMVLQVGETREFKERVASAEANVTQAVVYFKKAGKDVKLSDTLGLKLNAPPAADPAKAPVRPKR